MSLFSLIDNTKTDKNTIHSYIDVYENIFKCKKDTATNILEIGIYKGGSIKLWHDYFSNAIIYGVDIENNKSVFNEFKKYHRIKLHTKSDAYSDKYINQCLNGLKFDIIIDDGPHTLLSMKTFIEKYLQYLNDDGILIIEDIQNVDWIDELKNIVPIQYSKYIQIYDLRKNKNRYDDILFVINMSNC